MAPLGMAQVLRHLPPPTDPNLIVGVSTHDDAGVYRLTDEIALVQTVDFFPPVVDDPFVYGQIAAANALSDVYAMGGVPKTALNLVGFPDQELPMEILGRIIEGGGERCAAAGVTVVGGHTIRDAEVKFGLAVTGLVHPKRVVTNAGAKSGDMLVLTKALGTGIVTTAAKKEQCPPELLSAACASMIALNAAACAAMLAVGAHSATDVTGFGLAGHGREMADGSGVTLRIELAKLPVFLGVEEFARQPFLPRASKTNREYTHDILEIRGDPSAPRLELFFDAQTSGGLLISVPPERADELVAACRKSGAEAAAIIGEVLPRGPKALIVD
jgi:selenide, water dikinase